MRTVLANTSQAKGRARRLDHAAQNRLPNDATRLGIHDYDTPDTWLDGLYAPYLNAKFSFEPEDPELGELESCGFVRRYSAYGKKERGALYQLVDGLTLFHYKFLADGPRDERYWERPVESCGHNAWCGLAFERVCLEHVPQVKRALGISGVLTEVGAWSCKGDPKTGVHGSQMGLLIARRDHVIDLCEMKYVRDDYAVTKGADAAIRHELSDFRLLTKTQDALRVTLVTTHGLGEGRYVGSVQSVVTAEDLFA